MRMRVLVVAGLLAACALPLHAAEPAAAKIDRTKYLTTDKLRRGMKGYGLTVFKGTKPERFDVEIIGVLHNAWGVDSDIIFIRCSGKNLEFTGIAGGMSGSPIFVNDKLIGALAYGFHYGKAPLAGVTPIAEMLPVLRATPKKDVARKPASVKLAKPIQLFGREFSEVTLSDRPSDAGAADRGAAELRPIATPFRLSGLGPPTVAKRLLRAFGPELEACGLMPVQGGTAGAADAADAKIEPGALLGVRLLWGDLNWDAIGTVTEVVGNRLVAFGHPMFGQADVDIPITTGYVYTFVPSYRRSFKLGSGVKIVGRMTADRSTAIAGTLGATGKSVKVTVTVSGLDPGKPKTYRFEALRHPLLTPRVIGIAASSCLFQAGEPPEELTARYKITVTPEGRDPVVIENIESGWDGWGALARVYLGVSNAVALLAGNEFERVYPSSVSVEATFEHARRFVTIDAVALNRTTIRRGETLRATVELKHLKGARTRKTIDIPIPRDAPLGLATVQVCGAAACLAAERKDAPARFVPRTLDDALRLLRDERRRDRLYVRLSWRGTGVAFQGKELADLPPSVYGVIASRRQTGLSPVRSTVVTDVPCEVVVSGMHQLKLKIEEEK